MYKKIIFDIVIMQNSIGKTTKKLEINLKQSKKYRKCITFGFLVDIYSSKYYNLYSTKYQCIVYYSVYFNKILCAKE